MKKVLILINILSLAIYVSSAQTPVKQAGYYKSQVFEVTKVMVHDIVSPPQAARYYAYSNLAARLCYPDLRDIPLNDFAEIQERLDEPGKKVDVDIAAVLAMLWCAEKMLPSGFQLTPVRENASKFLSEQKDLKKSELKATTRYSESIVQHVLGYALNDGFTKLSTYSRYTPVKGEGFWYPTPPMYMEAIEPHWRTIRPFFMESAEQFRPAPPTPFSSDPESAFFKEQLADVYAVTNNLSEEQHKIAKFWDCNPFEVKITGHTMLGLKKITPGGHWIGIAGIACEKENFGFKASIQTHSLVGITLHDAFISCWDEKYNSNRIRPETVINKNLDATWRPILQTPPFPEYTSGHSVASGAAAALLTTLFGENFPFIDDTEIYFGLGTRSFQSFNQAAEEAAISRFYGGIHYMDACENGLVQGRQIGAFISSKIKNENI
jgi:hypothetical protein